MVLKTTLCRFSGLRIWPGRGVLFIRTDNQQYLFLNKKCKSLYHNRLRPAKLAWTTTYRYDQELRGVRAQGGVGGCSSFQHGPRKHLCIPAHCWQPRVDGPALHRRGRGSSAKSAAFCSVALSEGTVGSSGK
jgi:large subunit ribosomal protein L24e